MGTRKQETEEYRRRKLIIHVEASGVHCSGDCVGLSNDGEECLIFRRSLKWDRSCQSNGQFRLEECKEAEAQALAKNVTPDRGESCTRVKCENPPTYVLRWESKGAQSPVYAFCCKNHLTEALQDYQEDIVGDGFKISQL